MIITNKNVKHEFKSFTLSLPLLYQKLHPFTLAKRCLARHYNCLRTQKIQTKIYVTKKRKE